MTFPLRNAIGVLAAFCSLQAAPLQAQTIHEFSGQQISVPWTPSQGPFGRSVALSLTADPVPDVVVLCGQTPFVLADADPRDAKIQLALAVEDLDALPGGAPGGRDALVNVGAQGLVLTWFDAASGAFAHATLDAGAWADAQLVRAIDVDGDGLRDLVGVGGDGRSLLALRAQGPALAFGALAAGMASAPVRDLCAAQWDADAGLELALLTEQGVEVREVGGTLRDSWSSVLPGGAIARVRQTGMPTDRIAWITAYSPPEVQVLFTLAPGGAIHDSLELGALDVFAAVGGDYDLDGDDDVLVSHHYSNELIWFENERSPSQPLVTSFDTPNSVLTLLRVGPEGTQATLNQATPVSADLDGDGDLDVLYAAQTSGTLEILRGEALDEQAQKARIVAATWDPAATADKGALSCQIQAPPAGTGTATHLQVAIWRSASLGQPLSTQATFQANLPLAQGWPGTLAIPLPETTAEFAAVYAIELRLVVRAADGKAVAARPASIDLLAGNQSNADTLSSHPATLSTLGVDLGGAYASEMSTIMFVKRPRTLVFGGGYVPYL